MRHLIIFSLAALALFIAACQPTSEADTSIDANGEPIIVAQAATATPIPTAAAAQRTTFIVERGTVSEIYEFRARWQPRDQLELAFELNGNVRSVNVQRGDTVSAGSILADLQIDDLEAQLESQLLNLSSAERRLADDSTNSGDSVTSAQFNVANANLSRESQAAGLPWQSVNNAWANVEAARDDLEAAIRAYEDAVSFPTTAATTVDNLRESVDNAREALARAENDYFSAAASYRQAELNLAQQENNVLEAELALQDTLVSGGNPDLVDAVLEAQLQVDRTREQITQSTLIAPFDGVVLEVTIRPADTVQAFVGVITLALPEPLEAIANVPFNDTQLLQIGQIGICEEANKPETRVQCIIRQLPLSRNDVDQTTRVAATLPNTISGALIDITMTLSEQVDVLFLPPEAINTFGNRTFVVILTDEGERVQDVTVGLETDERVEILTGVNEGDVVVQQ